MPYQFPSPPLDREITTTPSSAIMNIATDWMLRVLRSDTLAARVAWTLRATEGEDARWISSAARTCA